MVNLWQVDRLQFARIIEEAQSAGAFETEVIDGMAESMDLEPSEVHELLARAQEFWDEHKYMGSQMCYKPYTDDQVFKQMAQDGGIIGYVVVDLSEIIDHNYEGFLNLLSERLIGDQLLLNVTHEVVACKGNELLIRVEGEIEFESNEIPCIYELDDNDEATGTVNAYCSDQCFEAGKDDHQFTKFKHGSTPSSALCSGAQCYHCETEL